MFAGVGAVSLTGQESVPTSHFDNTTAQNTVL